MDYKLYRMLMLDISNAIKEALEYNPNNTKEASKDKN